jgi:hypothetical protein
MKKKCRFCKDMFDVGDGFLASDGKGGKSFKCKPCNVLQVSAWKKANPKKVQAQFARYCSRKGQDPKLLLQKIIYGSVNTFEVA